MKNPGKISSKQPGFNLHVVEEGNLSFDSIEPIIEAYFNHSTKGFIDRIFKDWGSAEAAEFLYKVINLNREKFLDFAKSFENLHPDFNYLSRQCNGHLEDDDKIFMQCKRLSVVSDEILKSYIGLYFKERSNIDLSDRSPHIYGQMQRKEEAGREVGASR
ncbi:MAG: hypothetical protein K0R25_14 [Rickettsiaceae bacterium]|jgi:hypothetical protein|nr:hypothetical protein [Rickettsiaceae bacterium]